MISWKITCLSVYLEFNENMLFLLGEQLKDTEIHGGEETYLIDKTLSTTHNHHERQFVSCWVFNAEPLRSRFAAGCSGGWGMTALVCSDGLLVRVVRRGGKRMFTESFYIDQLKVKNLYWKRNA